MPRTILAGKPYPQGATWDGTGVNFALYSRKPRAWNCACSRSWDARHFETIALRAAAGSYELIPRSTALLRELAD